MKRKFVYLRAVCYPIVYSLLLTLICKIVYLWLNSIDSWGALYYWLIFIGLYVLIVSPMLSFVYCRIIHSIGKIKYFFCLYNAVLMELYYAISWIPVKKEHLTELVFNAHSIPVFATSLLTGFITLIAYDVKSTPHN